jgi:dethiobiotin synthetase
MRLGCLNHALLTAEAIIRDGLRLAGWVANTIDPTMAALEENIQTLKQIIPAPCLGVLPYQTTPNIEVLAECMNLEVLLTKPA